MSARAHIRLPDGSLVALSPGDVIGRHWTAAAWIPDPRVSEAHAMVSLRGPTLKLLALRGRFSLGEAPITELDLAAGQRISLARDLHIQVEQVEAPERVLVLSGPGLAEQVLTGVASLTAGDRPRLRRGVRDDADVVLWTDGESWRVRDAAGERALVPGAPLDVRGQTFQVRSVGLDEHGAAATQQQGRLASPLRIEVRLDTVHIHRDGRLVVRLVGAPARLVTEVALMDGPAPWDVVAAEVWPAEQARHKLRNRWDNGMSRLRRSLRSHGVRADLVQPDGSGCVELVLQPGDEVVDRA